MRTLALLLLAFAASPALAQHGGAVPDDYPDMARHRFCERMTDIALQALRDRDLGKPMKLFDEDGSDGTRVGNALVRKVYAEPGISSPKRAMAVGRGHCMELMQGK